MLRRNWIGRVIRSKGVRGALASSVVGVLGCSAGGSAPPSGDPSATTGPSGAAAAPNTSPAPTSTDNLMLGTNPVTTVAPPSPTMTGCVKDVDFVFSLDISLSMLPMFQKLVDGVDVVDAALAKLKLPSAPHYGLVVFVNDFEMTNNGVPYTSAAALKQAISNWLSFVSSDFITGNTQIHNKNPADKNYTWSENSLDSIYSAAKDFQWRPADTTLHMVIHTTNDGFWDGPEPPGCDPGWDNFPPPGGNQCLTKGSVHTYQQTVQALRDASAWVNIFAVHLAGPPDPISAAAGIYRGNAKDTSMGFFGPYNGMASIPDSTGGIAWDLDQVVAGTISLSQGIGDSIVAKQCATYPPPPPPPR